MARFSKRLLRGGFVAAYCLGIAGAAHGYALESAVYFGGAPGNYTAIVSGVGGTSGVGLVEVYGVN